MVIINKIYGGIKMFKLSIKLLNKVSVKQLTYLAIYMVTMFVGYIMYVDKYICHGAYIFK